MSTFDRALALVFREEGGHGIDPQDPGGDTWYGLARTYHPNEPWPPTKERVADIYRTDYWEPLHADLLPPMVAIALFDGAVNQGVETSAQILQRVLGVKVDGAIGPVTAHAASLRDPHELLIDVLTARAIRYAHTVAFEHFADTWFRRLFEVQQACLLDRTDPS